MIPENSDILLHHESSDKIFCKPISSLKGKIKRTTQLLKELKVLSQDCQELETNQEKDQQLFSRRTLQVGAEIQDARDLLSTICQNRLPARKWQFLFDSQTEVSLFSSKDNVSSETTSYFIFQDGEEANEVNHCLTGFDMDPSVQFLGIDWERVSGRCFSLSMHVNILESVLMEDSGQELDLVLINKMLRDLAAIEADVLSHSEAVLRGRLSQSQRQLILDQQVKYASLTSTYQPQVQSPSVSKIKMAPYLPTLLVSRCPRAAAFEITVVKVDPVGPTGKPRLPTWTS